MKADNTYTGLAPYYDRLMNHVNYRQWAAYIKNILPEHLPNNCKILEIAGGTGKFAGYFSKYYPEYILSDLSIQMLAIAKSRGSLTTTAADFSALPFKDEIFELVICLYDSINYVLTKEGVTKVLKSVYRVLSRGGYFLFDCCLINGSIEHSSDAYRTEYFRGVTIEQHSYRDESKNIHLNNFCIKFPDGRQEFETHKQKIYTLAFFMVTLNMIGFEIVHCFEEFSFDDATDESLRAHFLARKK